MALASSLLLSLGIVLVSFTFSGYTARSAIYGDAIVNVYQDGIAKYQVNLFNNDTILLNFKLKTAGVEDYTDIAKVNITQRVKGITPYVNLIFNRVQNDLYSIETPNTTDAQPVWKYGRAATVLSRSAGLPMYVTNMTVSNSQNQTLRLDKISYISGALYALATVPGVTLWINVL